MAHSIFRTLSSNLAIKIHDNDLLNTVGKIMMIPDIISDIDFHNYTFHGEIVNEIKIDNKYRFIREFSFNNSNLSNSRFVNFKPRGGGFANCEMNEIMFKNCAFHDFSFMDCNMKNAVFDSCRVQAVCGIVYFGHCNMNGVKFKFLDTYGNDMLVFSDCEMSDIDMTDCVFNKNKITIKNCNISGKFTNCSIFHLDASSYFKIYYLLHGGKFCNMNLFHKILYGLLRCNNYSQQ